jgi:hypothetical protein
MKKRAFAGFLWFLVGWYAGSVTAWMTGVDGSLSVILAAASAAVIVLDPLRIIWSTRSINPRGIEAAPDPA